MLQLRVAHCRADIAVAEHALDDLDALALRDQLTDASMAQLVRCVVRRAASVEQARSLAKLGPLVMDGVVRDTCRGFE